MKRKLGILAALTVLALALTACGGKTKDLKDEGVIHEPEFGGVYITNTIDQFNTLGYEYGDSVNVSFDNGYELRDIPYYNGYYTENGEPLLVAYPGYDYIKACINNGDDLWEAAGLSEDAKATVTLHEAGKYADIQAARDIHYWDDREKYPSDVVFANFRSVATSGIRERVLYRSASPCDNQHNRAPYVNDLIEEAGVAFILDLADTNAKIEKYIAGEDFDSPYFLSLYEAGKVDPLALNMNFLSAGQGAEEEGEPEPAMLHAMLGAEGFRSKVAAGFRAMTGSDGPYLVHCTEGKDRTGFVCLLMEALCGATYQEIVDDYMITYDNYYGINLTDDPDRYRTIVAHVLDPMVRVLAGGEEDFTKADLAEGAREYLRSGGMADEEIDAFRICIAG